MGDFFSRLAEKTLGVAPLVKPDLAPLFAVPSSRDTIAQDISTTVSRSVSTPQVDDMSSFVRPVVTKNSPPTQRRILHRGPQPGEGAAHSRDRNGVEGVDESSRSPAEPRAPLSTVVVEHARVDQPESGKMVEAPNATDYTTLTKLAERIFAEPAVDSEAALRRSKAVPPTVRVTIGRVEVRAVLPSVPAPRIVERKAPARLSLEEYLRARNEGRR